MDTGPAVALAVALVLVNGFFVAAEFAIVKLRHTQAEEIARLHGLFGRTLLSVRGHLDAYLSACQLGITLASLGLGWIGEPAVAALLQPLFHALGGSRELGAGVSFALAFTLLSFLHIVIGELAPKSLAIRRTVTTSLWTATPLFLFYWLMFPFIWLLNRSALLTLRVLGIRDTPHADVPHSAEELREVLAASHRHGELTPGDAELLSRALEFSDLSVGDLMRPLSRMVLLDAAAPFDATRALLAQHRYSRYPVCDGQPDQLIGLLHVKDLLTGPDQPPPKDLRPLVRPLPRADRNDPAAELFSRFRRNEPHFAIVTERAAPVGFVTLDDLLEALVGRIQDEFRRPTPRWKRRSDGSYEGRGWYSVISLERLLGETLETQADSVGGAVMERLDRLPRPGDTVQLDGIVVEVDEMREQRVERIHVRPAPRAPLQ